MDTLKLESGPNILVHTYNTEYLHRLASQANISIELLQDIFTSWGNSPMLSDLTDLDTYSNWTHVSDKSGFSFWKHSVTSFEDDALLNYLYAHVASTVKNMYSPHWYAYQGVASGESTDYFDYIYTYDDPDWSSNLGGASGHLTDTTNTNSLFTDSQILYIGDASQFSSIFFSLSIFGSGLTPTFEYWSGSAWTEITELMMLEDQTENFVKSNKVVFDSSELTGWATTTVNGQSAYWVRVTDSGGTRYPSAYQVIPSEDVTTLLHLTKDDISSKKFKWCYYNGYVYIPILNAGQDSLEGQTWISSSSSTTNKRRFFELYNIIACQHKLSTHPTTVSNRAGTVALNGTTGVAVTHNLGHTDYICIVTPTGGTARAIGVTKASNSVTIYAEAAVTDNADYVIKEF